MKRLTGLLLALMFCFGLGSLSFAGNVDKIIKSSVKIKVLDEVLKSPTYSINGKMYIDFNEFIKFFEFVSKKQSNILIVTYKNSAQKDKLKEIYDLTDKEWAEFYKDIYAYFSDTYDTLYVEMTNVKYKDKFKSLSSNLKNIIIENIIKENKDLIQENFSGIDSLKVCFIVDNQTFNTDKIEKLVGKLNEKDSTSDIEEVSKDNIDSNNNDLYYPSGKLKYTGEIKDDSANGLGTEYSDTSDGLPMYNGEFKDGVRSGHGTIKTSKGYFDGEFGSDNVEGIFTDNDGKKYHAEIKNNQININTEITNITDNSTNVTVNKVDNSINAINSNNINNTTVINTQINSNLADIEKQKLEFEKQKEERRQKEAEEQKKKHDEEIQRLKQNKIDEINKQKEIIANIEKEKNTKMLIDGKWEFVANPTKLREAQERLSELQKQYDNIQ